MDLGWGQRGGREASEEAAQGVWLRGKGEQDQSGRGGGERPEGLTEDRMGGGRGPDDGLGLAPGCTVVLEDEKEEDKEGRVWARCQREARGLHGEISGTRVQSSGESQGLESPLWEPLAYK